MLPELESLAISYKQAGDAIHAAIRQQIEKAGGFVNASNNWQEKPDMKALVFNAKTGYSETFPIRALKINASGVVEAYIGTFGTIYTDKYLRGKSSEEHWMPLQNSNILYYQTILSIARYLDVYLPAAE